MFKTPAEVEARAFAAAHKRVAHVTAIATDRVKPYLAAVTESGQLRTVGRRRGTRYHPA